MIENDYKMRLLRELSRINDELAVRNVLELYISSGKTIDIEKCIETVKEIRKAVSR